MTQTIDPYDDVAAMFLTSGEDPEPAPGAGATARAHALELLIVGHLPVRGSLWLTPYADAIAREEGATALVRIDGDEPMLQLLRGEDGAAAPTSAEARTLREAIYALGPAVRTWIVRPSSQAGVEALVASAFDRLTILTGADDAALVSTYKLIKEISLASEAADRDVPDPAVAVIGADRDRAGAFVGQLNRTTRQHLGASVGLRRCLPRIDAAVRSTWLRSFTGQARPALDDVVAWIHEARGRAHAQAPQAASAPQAAHPTSARESREVPLAHAGEPQVAPSPRAQASPVTQVPAVPREVAPRDTIGHSGYEPAPERGSSGARGPLGSLGSLGSLGMAETVRQAAMELLEEVAAAPPPATQHAPVADASDVLRARGARQPAPAARMELEPKAPGVEREPDEEGRPISLSRHVAGLVAIAPRCPRHERIELAIDAEGVVHLLGREEDLRELAIVAAWVREHREILAMACHGCAFDARGRTVSHVFTAAPRTVADLHGADYRLHVLAPVDVAGKRGWYTAPLN